jgi:hypothetical protein
LESLVLGIVQSDSFRKRETVDARQAAVN